MKDITEFPKQMIHPGYVKGTVTEIRGADPVSGRPFVDRQGTPDRYPPVSVINPDEEAQYRAKGYLPYGEKAMDAVGYQEYPKMLDHPDYQPAVPTIAAVTNGGGQQVSPEIPGKAAKFPSVTVHNKTEQKKYEAQGYVEPGKSDPDAVRAALASPHDPDRVTRQYPMMVDGVMVQDPEADQGGPLQYPKWINIAGHPHGGKEVKSRAEEIVLVGEKPEDKAAKVKAKRDAALAAKAAAEAALAELDDDADADDLSDEPHVSSPAAIAAVEALVGNEREALIAEATGRGIKVDKRWNAAKLRKALEQVAA